MPESYTAEDVRRYRVHAQELDRPLEPGRSHADAAVLDLGLQYTGDSAGWSLRNRGVPVGSVDELDADPDLALVWTLRGAPHFYRRADLRGVQVATSPFSVADANRRIYDAAKPLKAAGLSAVDAIAEIGGQMHTLAASPIGKGDLSSALTTVLGPEHLRYCRPCSATHPWEMPFRLAPLHAGLELVPGTSPPVVRRIPGWRRAVGVAPDPESAPEHLQVIRAYLRLLGPATPQDVAGFLDAPVADVTARWPADSVEVRVDGEPAWALGDTEGQLPPDAGQGVRLLSPFDLFLQARARHRLAPVDRHKELWPTLGRPGAILRDGTIVGVWRPKTAARRLTVRTWAWRRLSGSVAAAVEEQAAQLARYRGLQLGRLTAE